LAFDATGSGAVVSCKMIRQRTVAMAVAVNPLMVDRMAIIPSTIIFFKEINPIKGKNSSI
ncbi:MAG: hypothetical protein ACKVON_10305, partial [Beijerinckiaceae bacterium]